MLMTGHSSIADALTLQPCGSCGPKRSTCAATSAFPTDMAAARLISLGGIS
jgi:hypothetical protein